MAEESGFVDGIKTFFDAVCEKGFPILAVIATEDDDRVRVFFSSTLENGTERFRILCTILDECMDGQVDNSCKNRVQLFAATEEKEYDVLAPPPSGGPEGVRTVIAQCNDLPMYDRPWFLAIELPESCERLCKGSMLPFERHPAFNIVQYLAMYTDVSDAATAYTQAHFQQNRDEAYKLFQTYLE